jgi:hypothetical protein
MGKRRSSKTSDQLLEFVFVDQRPGEGHSTSLKDVRSHAMREALRQKKLGKHIKSPGSNAHIPYKTGRFRLLASSENKTASPNLKHASEQTICEENLAVEEVGVAQQLDPKSISTTLTSFEPSRLIDPFRSAPITVNPQQQKLLWYCK